MAPFHTQISVAFTTSDSQFARASFVSEQSFASEASYAAPFIRIVTAVTKASYYNIQRSGRQAAWIRRRIKAPVIIIWAIVSHAPRAHWAVSCKCQRTQPAWTSSFFNRFCSSTFIKRTCEFREQSIPTFVRATYCKSYRPFSCTVHNPTPLERIV